MYSQLLIFVLAISVTNCANCPCADQSLCRTRPVKEDFGFYGFSTSQDPNVYQKFNWTKISTLIVTSITPQLPQLICYAKSRNVRVTLLTDISVKDLMSPTATQAYVKSAVAKVQANNLDGLNMDFESNIAVNSTAYFSLTVAMSFLRTSLNQANRNYSLSMDYVNCATCVGGRTYDFRNLAKVIDYFIIMDYDMQGNTASIFQPVTIKGKTNYCKILSNSPFPVVHKRTEEFMSLGVPASKLVLAFPWYGYEDKCEIFDQEIQACYTDCANKDKGGLQRGYGQITDILRTQSSEGRQWNTETLTPTLSYISDDAAHTQVNYDDPWSLKIKYNYALQRRLRGIGAWTINSAPNGVSIQNFADRELMWSVIPKPA